MEVPKAVQIIVWLPVAIIVISFAATVLRALFSPLRRIPGPFLSRFTRLWYLRQTFRGDFEKTNVQLHRKYGPIVRIAPNEYSIDDFDALKTIYGHGSSFIKAPWYEASGRANRNHGIIDLFTDRDPKSHAGNRRKVAGLYAMSRLVKMEPQVNQVNARLVEQFKNIARRGEVINLQFWLQCYAFDVITTITLDESIGFLREGKDIGGMLHSIHNYLRYCASVGVYSEWHSTLSNIIKYSNISKGMSVLVNFIQDRITQRLKQEKVSAEGVQDDFLGAVLKMHQDDPNRFTMEEVFMVCRTNIGAGSDTTSISLSGILYNLIKNPRVLQKLRAEIDGAIERGECSDPIAFGEAQKLPYLQAVTKEALRLHPATGLPLYRVVPKEGAMIAGTFFPGGSIVGTNTWVSHVNEEVFGADADQFRPERWLECTPTDASRMERAWMPFGAGSRTCIGQHISRMEMDKVIPEIVRRFDFELVHNDDLKCKNVWFVKQENLICRVFERSDRMDFKTG